MLADPDTVPTIKSLHVLAVQFSDEHVSEQGKDNHFSISLLMLQIPGMPILHYQCICAWFLDARIDNTDDAFSSASSDDTFKPATIQRHVS